MIEFDFTWQHKGIVGFQNEKAETVARYPYIQFEDWCIANKIDDGTDVEKYIDTNWISLTKDFYMAMNKDTFKSNQTPQSNRYPFGAEGIYNIQPATKSK